MQGSLNRRGADNPWKNTLKQYLGQIVFLAVIFILLSVLTKTFLTSRNLINVSR